MKTVHLTLQIIWKESANSLLYTCEYKSLNSKKIKTHKYSLLSLIIPFLINNSAIKDKRQGYIIRCTILSIQISNASVAKYSFIRYQLNINISSLYACLRSHVSLGNFYTSMTLPSNTQKIQWRNRYRLRETHQII